MPLPILTTKLNIPASRSNVVVRERLITQLTANPTPKLTLVSAPAGFGKTTLVTAWLQEIAQPVAWLSLDSNDNDPTHFGSYLVHALRRVCPNIGTGILSSLQSPQPPALPGVMTHLINEFADSGSGCVLVLDDVHVIDHAEVWDGLALLVDNQPQRLHLVITTREDPPLPLARLRARGELLEIRAKDLRFTKDEAADFLTHAMAIELTVEQISKLEERTEGWIAGLQLAAISLQEESDREAFIEAFSGSHRFVLDYLSDEVLRNLPDDIRLFLLKTSILDQLTAEMCDAVMGRDDSVYILQQLEEMNLFLIQLDHERQWYRYHNLFAQMLRKQLHQQHADQMPVLHAHASDWYEQKGLTAEAIDHAARGGHIERLADLIEIYARDIIMRGQIRLAHKWIDLLPVEILDARPRISMDYGWVLFLSRDYQPIPKLLDRIEDTTQSTDILGEASALRAFLHYDYPGLMQEYSLHALDIVSEDNLMVRGLVHMGMANVHVALGEKHTAFDHFAEAIPHHWAAGNRVAAGMAVLDLVLLSIALGAWKRTLSVVESIMEMAEQSDAFDDPAIGIVHIAAGWILLHLNRPEESLSHIQQGIELTETSGYRELGMGWFAMVMTLAYLGDKERAQDAYDRAVDRLAGLPDTFLSATAILITQACLTLDRLDEAERWLERYEGQDVAFYELTRARLGVKRAQKSRSTSAYDLPASLLGNVIRLTEANQWNGHLIEALILRTIVRHAGGDIEAALDDLRRALALAEPQGMLYDFIREADALHPLLKRLNDNSFARDILSTEASFPQERVSPLTHPSLPEPLSERELEVLSLMTEGLTYNDIAKQLMISVNTVRYHVKGLYGKLGVSSRAGAIAKGQALNFL